MSGWSAIGIIETWSGSIRRIGVDSEKVFGKSNPKPKTKAIPHLKRMLDVTWFRLIRINGESADLVQGLGAAVGTGDFGPVVRVLGVGQSVIFRDVFA